jgi:hypothetical protein
MQSAKKPSLRSFEVSKLELRGERKSSPPPGRRDGRAEPDDDHAPRIDVVKVDGSNADGSAAGGMMSLKAQFARLAEQAAAVEKTIDDQRRDRAEAFERLDRANERASQLEAKVEPLEADLASLRKVQAAAIDELESLRAERDSLSRSREDANDNLTILCAKLEHATTDVTAARRDADSAIERATHAEDALRAAVDETRRIVEELAQAKELHATERAIARGRIDLIDRALDTAREHAARAEAELDTSRTNEEHLAAQLASAVARANDAETRAALACEAQRSFEASVLRLREDVASAFARLGSSSTPPSASPEDDSDSVASELVESLPPSAPPAPMGALTRHTTREVAIVERAAVPSSIPPLTYASVPPQLHDVPAATLAHAEVDEQTSSGDSGDPSLAAREVLIGALTDEARAVAATAELLAHPEWLLGTPPSAFIEALQHVAYDSDRPVFEVAREWEQEPLCASLLGALRAESEPRARVHGAWLVKHFAVAASSADVLELAGNEDEVVPLRRWLLEAIDRLVSARAIGWLDVRDFVARVSKSSDASLRDGVIAIVVALEKSDERPRVLFDILRSEGDDAVIANALRALSSMLPYNVEQDVLDRLLQHESASVKASAEDLAKRIKAANT